MILMTANNVLISTNAYSKCENFSSRYVSSLSHHMTFINTPLYRHVCLSLSRMTARTLRQRRGNVDVWCQVTDWRNYQFDGNMLLRHFATSSHFLFFEYKLNGRGWCMEVWVINYRVGIYINERFHYLSDAPINIRNKNVCSDYT